MEFSTTDFADIFGRVQLYVKKLQFGNKKQLAFLEDLYVLINDGIPANRAVEMMSKATRGITQEVAQTLTTRIGEGQPLAEGMREWFNSNVVEIVRVGEAGGALAQTLKSAINMLSQQGMAMGAFVGALAYPLFVIAIACAVIIYINSTVFSQFRAIKPISAWPPEGQRMVHIANFIKTWWWLVIFMVISFFVLLRIILINYVGELRSLLDNYPPFSLYKRLVAARVLETLGLLVSNGVVFKSAIKVMQYQANPYMLSHLAKMEHLLSLGKTNIADVLDTGLIEPNDLMRLRVMAEVKGFEHGLVRMGIRGAEQATATLKLIAKVVGGVFLVCGGYLIIIIIQGVYLTGMAMGSQ
jgi:type II secretory pathway component PulF